MSRALHIAYVIKSMAVGGTQTHLLQVLRFLDRERFSPAFVCLSDEGALLEQVRELGVPVLPSPRGKGFKGLGLATRVRALAAELRRQRPDIVHNYLLRANLVGSISARLAGVPIVLCSKRGCHERRGYELIAAKVGNALADRVTANADAVRDFVHRNEVCPVEKMAVIPSGINTDRFQPLPSADFKARIGVPSGRTVIGAVMRNRARKGVDEFVQAIALVRCARPDVHCVIAGEVELSTESERLVRQLGMAEHLTLLGRCNDMPRVLSAFDLFVLSSHDEGMSNAVLEAMAMEKAVVATDVGGTGEVVRHGHSGLLVPPKDPVALAQAIGEILNQPERLREMGRAGRRIVVERFSAMSMVRQMEALYLELARERGIAAGAESKVGNPST
jgi:glycosyltransferase involved in cell wall biosynthesis